MDDNAESSVDQLGALDAVHVLIEAGTKADTKDLMICGAIVIGLYTTPDGAGAAVLDAPFGNMNVWTQRGILDDLLSQMRTLDPTEVVDE